MAAARGGRAGGDPAGDRQPLRRLRAPARRTPQPAPAVAPRGPPVRVRRARSGAGRAGAHGVRRLPADRGRVRLRDDRPARTAARRDHAHHPPAPQGPGRAHRARPGAGDAVRGPGGDPGAGRSVHHGHLGRAVGAGQRTARAPTGGGAVLDRRHARHQRRVPGVRRGRRLRRPALVDARGLGARAPRPPHRAAVLAPGGRAVAAAPFRGHRTGAAGRAGAARVLVRGGRVRPLGGAQAAHRDRVGEGRPARPGHGPLPALPVG